MIQDTIHEVLANLGISASFTSAPPHHPINEPIPAPPSGEPQLDAGPTATWADLVGRPATPADVAKIKEAIRRFEKASDGHAAYWLTRAMTCVAMEEHAPLTITYASGILRRMQEQHDWSTEELHRRAKEQRIDPDAASPASLAARAKARVARGKAKPPSETATAPAASLLAKAIEEAWPIATWRTYAGSALAITQVRAQQIIVRVTDHAAWETVLANWQTQYQERPTGPNWAHFDGLLERYDREVAAGGAPPAPQAGPPIPTTLIYHHPALQDDPALSHLWNHRLADALQNKAAQQAVLRRLLHEHPLPAEVMIALQIPEQP